MSVDSLLRGGVSSVWRLVVLSVPLAMLACSSLSCRGGRNKPPASAAKQPPRASESAPKKRRLIRWTGKPGSRWADYDRLRREQRYEAAAKLALQMVERARKEMDSEQWVRALTRYVKLRTALHGYETAVRYLKEQTWPQDLLGYVVLQLFYAKALVQYAQMYSWEIRKRERIVGKGPVDLKAWTSEQIYAEASRAYAAAWQYREQLGGIELRLVEEYISPNNYPRDIRGSLRHAVVYLWSEHLANTRGWTAVQTNSLCELSVARLISGTDIVSPTDPAHHPLETASALLGRLETWQRQQGRSEGALEARLQRLRMLHGHLKDDAARKRVRDDLEQSLKTASDLPWWAVGMADLAEMVRTTAAEDRLIRARAIALRGHRAHPQSLGGRKCLHIVRSIDQPHYRLEAMRSDAAQRRSLGVHYKNLQRLFLRAYRIDAKQMIEEARDYSFFPGRRRLRKLLRGKPTYAWAAKLPPTKDFEEHRKYLVPPITDPGLYVVVASIKEDFAESNNVRRAVAMVIGDLVLARQLRKGRLLVEVLSGRDGRPVAGVDVYLYRYDWRSKHHLSRRGRSDAKGQVRFALSKNQPYFLVASRGRQIALDPDRIYHYRSGRRQRRTATLIYTDRSAYRPQQTIRFKALVYEGDAAKGNYRLAKSRQLTLSLRDANYQSVASAKLKTNRYGTASGSFAIPKGRVLGRWSLVSSLSGSTSLRVEEYKRPTFEVRLEPPNKALRLNRQAQLSGVARYFFGLPLADAKAKWRVTREPLYPSWWSYSRRGRWSASRQQVVAAGVCRVDQHGRFSLAFLPKADERLAKLSQHLRYGYRVSVDVTDEGGETRSAQRYFRLGFVAIQSSIGVSAGFYRAQRPDEIAIVRSDLDGVPAPGAGRYRLIRLEDRRQRLLPADLPYYRPPGVKGPGSIYESKDDRRRSRWSPRYHAGTALRLLADAQQIVSGPLRHGKDGAANIRLPSLSCGAYRIRYSSRDAFGARLRDSAEFVVGGPRCTIAVAGLLRLEKSSVRVGEQARLFVASGLKNQRMRLEVFRRGRRVFRRSLVAGASPSLIALPVGPADRGGFSVALSLLRDHQWIHLQRSVYVPWDNKALKVSFSSFRDKLRPGSKETWTVRVTGPAGKDKAIAAAEILAYMYDRALDTITPHSPPQPASIWPGGARYLGWQTSLGQAGNLGVSYGGLAPLPSYPSLARAQLRSFAGYGIGGPGSRAPHLARSSRRSLGRNGRARRPARRAQSVPAEAEPVVKKSAAKEQSSLRDEAKPVATESSAQADKPLRSNFSETAFWRPHLLTDARGTARIAFSVPDSVTSWNVWVHAITQDLRSGSKQRQARSVKELMVRPYLPRFLREGDRVQLRVVVNNASDKAFSGKADFDIIDPVSGASLAKEFELAQAGGKGGRFLAPPNKGTSLVYSLRVPHRVGPIAVRVRATSGQVSDGELRSLAVLPGRMHLSQSRFAVLEDAGTRTLSFADLKRDDDRSRMNQQMVVTVDGQLFYSVLSALPYLVNYPYQCTEQTLNRFLATGILSSLYGQYPAVAKMARAFSRRTTRLERWDAPDPNRAMTLEETPWLRQARGGRDSGHRLANVLDPRITLAQRRVAVARLKKAQTAIGGFPWFAGGPPSPYITLYLLHGFSKALEFRVPVPKGLVQRAWRYMHRHYIDHLHRFAIARDCCWELVTLLNYVLSNYPDAKWYAGLFSAEDRDEMLRFSFRHWRDHAPYLKGYLALTLHRMGRKQDAQLVWQSVMDSAKSSRDQGTYWAPEDRSWLWYNDTIETHAFAVRTLLELSPTDAKLDGLVLWLFLNKKFNHWKSTRATAEVLYSLTHYLKQTRQLAQPERIDVAVGAVRRSFAFDPAKYTGKRSRVVIAGPQLDPKTQSAVVVSKRTRGYALASATWHYSTEKMPASARGDYLRVSRRYFRRVKGPKETVLQPLGSNVTLRPGDEVEVQISLRAKHGMQYVHLRDPRGAGFEPISQRSRHRWDLGLYWYEEIRDSGTNFFFEQLPQGEYTFKYRLRAAVAGTFKVAPAKVQPMYAPEFVGHSSGATLRVAAPK